MNDKEYAMAVAKTTEFAFSISGCTNLVNRLTYQKFKKNIDSPMSDNHDNTDPERFPSSPDQLEKDSLVERPDPSQAKYEVLISNLFDRIRTS